MKTQDKDILENMKKMPFRLPEGYMDSLKAELKTIPERKERKINVFQRLAPYVSLAAAFALIATAGGVLIKDTMEEEYGYEDYIVFSEDMTSIILYDSEDQYADVLTEEDLIDYLIYTGTEVEELY